MCVLMPLRVTEPNDQLRRLLLVLHSYEAILDRVMASLIVRIGALILLRVLGRAV